MKRRTLSLLLSIALLTTLFGCGKSASVPADTTQVQEAIEAPAQQEAPAAEASTAEEASAEEAETEEEAVTTGGTPWIDSDLKENITADTEINPKDDFHLYANKDWILENEIPDGYSSWSHYSERGLEVKKQCMELLKDETIEGHDADLIRTYNKLMLDWDARNKLGVSEIQEGFDKIVNISCIDDVTKLITDKAYNNTFYDFVGYGVDTGLNDPETYIVYVDTPGVILQDSAEYTERTELGDIYYNSFKERFKFIAGKLGMSNEDAEKYYDAAIDLETKMAPAIYTTRDRNSDDYYEKINNEMSFDELTSLSKVFPLKDILTMVGYKFDGVYLVTTPDYFGLLDELYNDSNIEGIKGLMLNSYILEYSRYLDEDIYGFLNDLSNEYFGTTGRLSDEENAYNKVVEALPCSMQKVYIAKYGSDEDKKKMEDLCQQVIDTYREMLEENTWASEEVKKNAIEKLDKMEIHAAYPDKFRDTSKLDLTDCTLIEANKRIMEAEHAYSISLLGKKRDKEMWAEGFNILDCNAFYSFTENTINMIIGMMGEPFYSSDMSVEELYASIGAFWVGHEISHAFDNGGSQFDANGEFKDWWTKEDKEEFERRTRKMDDYLDTIVAFGDYHFIGTNIDTEMIADMTGLQCALKMASKVDGFDYDKFFTKYAQMNCRLSVYNGELSQLLQNEHPLEYSRTNVPVQQFEEFYETYDVQPGDGMYLAPEDRLIVW